MTDKNIYLPYLMRIAAITQEAPGVRTFRLEFVDEAAGQAFDFKTGQFGLYSAFGEGESTFCIASSPTRKGYIECTFREVGRVTAGLADKEVGDIVGFRGPYGNVFPIESWKGKNLLFITGGIALPPLRSVIWNCLDLRDQFKDITIVYGARSVNDLVYKHELKEWEERPDVNLVCTVDPGGETPDNTIALVCGPPILIKLTMPLLGKLGFTPDSIYTTLENRMKCGLGKCGRCNTGKSYVCKDGPVYTLDQLNQLPAEY
jgi:NAD(P)H-flavin reductase